MSEQTKKSYKNTLNLPKTSFSMKANLVQREPQFQQRWDKMELYRRMREEAHPKGEFLLHDGPPYANGSIHLGHLLNKVLKDIVVRSKAMAGYDTPFVPGWDCHGLPIEHKVMKELGEKARGMEAFQIRRRCQSEAEKFVKLQAKQMQRLGTVGDYEDPYLTMKPRYEAAVLEVFADLVSRGLVYRALKPVHWSIANQTALAEAELEYKDREDTSVFVDFESADAGAVYDAFGLSEDERPGQCPCFMIWTTTPWTLPANMAVAVHPDYEYALAKVDGNYTILASELLSKVAEAAGSKDVEVVARTKGAELIGLRYRHPFVAECPEVRGEYDPKAVWTIVGADYVTLEDGTGLVHTAPGHGVEDYQTGLRCGLPIYCPVRGDGTFDATAPEWLQGKDVWEGNGLVVEKLSASGHLYHSNQFMHSYPHDWRSKTPVIFRATEQWFVSVDRAIEGESDSLRDRAMRVTEKDVRFIPEWGRNRMRGMLESRPDWCLSRQRAWGLPIPAFFHENEEPLLTARSVLAVAETMRQHGSDAWFKMEPADLLGAYDPSADEAAPAWAKEGGREALAKLRKSSDIFDVWFESGSSWHAVLQQREMGYPADLYLEGSDQHRGWFQLSLLPALGVTGRAPFETVLTHGFMVDAQGMKMSKSQGNALNVDDLLKDSGADVCRWWVSSLNVANDIKVDREFFRLAGEEYRKVRNTIRFLLSNLADFDVSKDRRELTEAEASSIDGWARQELDELVRAARESYDGYNFRRMHEALFNFCNDTVSAVYLAAVKDRLYCDKPDSDRRRRTQTVMYDMVDALIRLVAPVLVHTAEEAWLVLQGKDVQQDQETSVHLQLLPEPIGYKAAEGWGAAMALREKVLKALEEAKSERGIENPLDAGIEAAGYVDLKPFEPDLADLCGVSRFHLVEGEAQEVRVVDLRDEPRCERSWKRDETVKERSDGGMLTDRDAEAVGVA